jgi:hypothetical protein
VRQRGLGKVEDAGEVDRQHLVPAVVGHLGDRAVGRDARVVDENVEPPVLLDDLGDRAPAVIARGDVTLVQRHLDALADVPGAEFFGEGLGPGQVASLAGRDRRTLARQALADRGADAARAPP